MKRATRVDAATKSEAGCARVTVPFETGSVYLASTDREGGDLRLVWQKGDKALPVPPGLYRIRNWSIEREHGEETWILSVTSPSGIGIEIKAGEELALDLDPKVHVEGLLERHKKRSRLQLTIRGGHGCGLSVLRKDRLVEIGYRIDSTDGHELGKGVMTYG